MMKRKALIVTLTSLLIVSVFVLLGFGQFVSAIRNQRTCEWANIDNIELHAHVDIPAVTKWDCNYEKEDNTKKASFTIDKNKVDLDKYIQTNNLKKLSSAAEPEYHRFLNLQKDSLSGAELYHNKNLSNGEHTEVLLDKSTGSLWVTINYKD